LAALAGAAALQAAGDGCAAARDVARANGAALERCAVSGDEVEVTATRLLAVPVIGGVTVRGRARSGPSSARTGLGLRPP
ncbi:MAG: hypothetical protein ACXVWU_08130, partial [Nocardioides sp.]